jgi:ATP-dependent DNA helicase RecG
VSSAVDALATPLQYLKGVGPRRAADLLHAGLSTIEDLLYRFPLRYEDRSRLQPIAALRAGTRSSVLGKVLSCALRSTRRPGFKIFEVLIGDESGALRAVWLNQPFLRDVFAAGQRVVLYGDVEMRGGAALQLTNAQYEILDEGDTETIHTGRIVPVYEKAGAVTTRIQRKLVYEALERLPGDLPDPLSAALRARLRLPTRAAALLAAHFPPADTSIDQLNRFATPAQRRLIFEEAFIFQMGVLARRRIAGAERKPAPLQVNDHIRASARAVLPFRLTAGQRQALKEIVEDQQSIKPMNRLLQGDVGAGKTIVALLAALVAMENGQQVAFMAPTEILAEQHFLNISRLLARAPFRVVLVTGRSGVVERREQRAELASGAAHLAVGTHALVEGDVQFKRLGLVVIDEQHRFGVLQRATLRAKGLLPDVLVMTATPIPRTLALTVYGDLDVSMIRDTPPGRLPVKSLAKPASRRDEVYAFVRRELQAGRQVYVIYPLVEESAKVDLRAATDMADTLAHDVFPEYHVGLLHGRMKPDVKDRVMKAFAAGELDVLVATTVVEVGIDVPNASVIVIEHAERFGLSQLHQLRGRVGRGAAQSYCWMLYEGPLSEEARERLRAMTETTDGFEIAERDLRLRGPGDFFGTRQAGMPTFRSIDLVRDRELLEVAQAEASAALQTAALSPQATADLITRWRAQFHLIEVG